METTYTCLLILDFAVSRPEVVFEIFWQYFDHPTYWWLVLLSMAWISWYPCFCDSSSIKDNLIDWRSWISNTLFSTLVSILDLLCRVHSLIISTQWPSEPQLVLFFWLCGGFLAFESIIPIEHLSFEPLKSFFRFTGLRGAWRRRYHQLM